MLVNWDAEKLIWDRVFSPEALNVNTQETSLLVTEPYFNLPNIAETYDQMVFEEWEFASYFRCPRQLILSRDRKPGAERRSCRSDTVWRLVWGDRSPSRVYAGHRCRILLHPCHPISRWADHLGARQEVRLDSPPLSQRH